MRRVPAALIAAYPVAWLALFQGSTLDGFFPAGLRVAALWLTPTRYWPALAAAEWIATAVVAATTSVHASVASKLVGIFLPWLIYAAAVHEVRRLAALRVVEGTTYWIPFTVAAGLLGAGANAMLLTGLQWLDATSSFKVLDLLLRFALGDYIGIIVLAPLLVLAAEHRQAPAAAGAYLHRGWVALPLLGLALGAAPAIGFPPQFDWFLISAPLLAIGTLAGRRPAVVALALLALALTVLDLPALQPEEVQRILAIAGTGALLLGARRDAMRRQRERLSASIDELELKTQALREVATRISSQREAESRQLGLELHDEVGQDMTALATRLQIAERMARDESARQEFEQLQRMVSTAHEHLRSVIRHLHPIALERFGLRRALEAGPLAEIAADASLAYHCELTGDVDGLPHDVATAVYRICQEAVTNGVRHGCGGRLEVRLDLHAHSGGRRLRLAIFDRAGTITLPAEPRGVGLQGIRDRAHALGAQYRFDAASGDPRHLLELQLPSRDGPPGGYQAAHGAWPGGTPRRRAGDTLFLAEFLAPGAESPQR